MGQTVYFFIKREDWEMGWPDERHHQKSSHILQSGQSLAGLAQWTERREAMEYQFQESPVHLHLLKALDDWVT